MSTDRPQRAIANYDGEATGCPYSSNDFAKSVGAAIISTLPVLNNWSMHISAGTPPYESNVNLPAGHIELTLIDPEEIEYTIGLVFAATDDAGQVLRQPFDSVNWANNPGNPWSAGIAMFNFDEAWRVVVLLVETLDVKHIEISYGMGM